MLDKLIITNIDALQEGKKLLGQLGADNYTKSCEPAFLSTIGAHFRHVLEHYQCLFDQLSGKQICYDKRCRNQQLEVDIDYALQQINSFIQQLQSWHGVAMDQSLVMTDEQTDQAISSTLQRELLFLQSHTTHHYAIVAAMSRLLGIQPDADFGVAIATRIAQYDCYEVNSCAR